MPDPLPDEDLQGYPVPATATLEAAPGRAIIGTQAVPVGVQPPFTQADLTAWQSRQPNLDVGVATQQAIARAAEENLMRELRHTAKVTDAAKAIESAMRFQGLRSYERDLAALKGAGLPDAPAHAQALARNAGRMFWSSPATALKAMTPPAPVPAPSVVTLPGMPPGVRSGRYGERFSFPPQPPASAAPPKARQGEPVTDASGNVIGTDVGGGRILPVPKAAAEGKLSDVDKARIAAIGHKESAVNTAIAGLKPSNPKYIAGTNQLAVLDAEREGILRKATTVAVPHGKSVAVPGQGTKDDPARPETPEQMASIPSGAIYRNPADGKLYRKK